MRSVDAIPIFDGHAWSKIALTPHEAEVATWGKRNGFVVVDQYTRLLVLFWFFCCETRNRPSIMVLRRKRGRAEVTLDLYCTDRCLTLAGWKAVADAYEGHGGPEMAKLQKRGLAFADYAHGTVPWFTADRLARELLAIVSAGSFVRVCHRAPEGAGMGRQ